MHKSDKHRFWLVGLIRFYRSRYRNLVLALLLALISALLSLLLPLVFSLVIDSAIGQNEPDLPARLLAIWNRLGGRVWLLARLWVPGLIILGLTLVDGLLTFWRGRSISRFAELGARQIRQTLFDHIQSLPFAWHARVETGDLVQRCTSDVETIRRFFNNQLVEVVRSLTLILFAVVVLFQIDSRLALIGLLATPIIFVTSAIYFRKERDAFKSWDEAEGTLSTVLQEYLTGVRVVKAFARQAYEQDKFMTHNRTLRDFGWKTFTIIANFWMFSDFLCLAQIATTTVIGAIFVIGGRISLGQLVIFISYTEMLLYPLRGLARIIADAGRMHVAWQRLDEVMQVEPEPDDASLLDPELSGAITFAATSFTYEQSERPVLQAIDLEIRSGETVGILGPTGSGKSTLLYLLQRLYEPTGGRILFDGIDLSRINRASVRRQVGLILQEPFVYSRNVRENIRLPRPEATDDAVVAVARTAALHDDISSFEQGYDTMVGERGVTLSGGQKQRLTIARTLIRDCPILVFDDSMSAVDTDTDLKIRRELKTRRQRATTLIVSHRIATLAGADRIIVLEDGRISDQGSHRALISRPGLYQRVYQIQSQLLDADEPGEVTP
jgi:ATP-binding cassette subfamily B protein